jgi:hypothetical protein
MTYNRKRLVAVLLLLYVIFTAANCYFGLGVLPRFAKQLMLLGVFMVLICVPGIIPTRGEIEEHRRKTRERQR